MVGDRIAETNPPTPTKQISPILIADSVTPTASRQKDGKLRIVYAGWNNAKVVQVHEVLELRAS